MGFECSRARQISQSGKDRQPAIRAVPLKNSFGAPIGIQSEVTSSHRRISGAIRRITQPSHERLFKAGKSGNFGAMKFLTTLERDEDGIWVAQCPSIPGCVSQGETRDEAMANIREAIAGCLEVRAERGMPLTIETREVEVAV